MAIIACMRLNQWPFFLLNQLYYNLYTKQVHLVLLFIYFFVEYWKKKSYMHTKDTHKKKPLTLIKRNDRHMKIDTQMSMKCVDIIRKKIFFY